jgi:hypothetical protein
MEITHERLFHIPDPVIAAALGPHLHEAGYFVIADPAHLTSMQRHNRLYSLAKTKKYGIELTVHSVEWTTLLTWDPDQPAAVARDIYMTVELINLDIDAAAMEFVARAEEFEDHLRRGLPPEDFFNEDDDL